MYSIRESLIESKGTSQTGPGVHTHTRIHWSPKPIPCHPMHPPSAIRHLIECHPYNPIRTNPYRAIQTFSLLPFLDRPGPCSRLVAATWQSEEKKLKRASRRARTVRHVKNLISLARLVSSLFISRSLFPPRETGDASPVFYLLSFFFLVLVTPYHQAARKSAGWTIHRRDP